MQSKHAPVMDHGGNHQTQQERTYRHGGDPGPSTFPGRGDSDPDQSAPDRGAEEGEEQDVHRRVHHERGQGREVGQGEGFLLPARGGGRSKFLTDQAEVDRPHHEHGGKSPVQRQTDESAHDSGNRAGAALGKTQTVSPVDEVVLGGGLRGPLSAVVAHTFPGSGTAARPDHGSVRRCSMPPPNSCPAPRSPTPPRKLHSSSVASHTPTRRWSFCPCIREYAGKRAL